MRVTDYNGLAAIPVALQTDWYLFYLHIPTITNSCLKKTQVLTPTQKKLTSCSNHVLIVTRDINSFASNQTQIWDKYILMYFLCCTWGFVQTLNVFQHLFHRVKSSSHKFILNLLRCCAKRNVLNLDVFWLKCCSPSFFFILPLLTCLICLLLVQTTANSHAHYTLWYHPTCLKIFFNISWVFLSFFR